MLANAKLVIAAPDLLEACELIVSIKDLISYPSDTKEEHYGEAQAISNLLSKAEAAITKALGEES